LNEAGLLLNFRHDQLRDEAWDPLSPGEVGFAKTPYLYGCQCLGRTSSFQTRLAAPRPSGIAFYKRVGSPLNGPAAVRRCEILSRNFPASGPPFPPSCSGGADLQAIFSFIPRRHISYYGYPRQGTFRYAALNAPFSALLGSVFPLPEESLSRRSLDPKED